VNINKPVNCETSNVVYLVECIKCKSQYVGQTGREFKARMKENLGYIRNKKISEPTGQHFKLPGHDISMFRASILEVCKSERRVYREHREENFIQAFQTKLKGMNSLARCTSNFLLINFICKFHLCYYCYFVIFSD